MALSAVFHQFATGDEMDGAKFAKFSRDCKVLSKRVTSTDVDLAFAKVKAKGSRRINEREFEAAVALLAAKRHPSLEGPAAMDKLLEHVIASGGGPKYTGTRTDASTGIYSKLTDSSGYTGAHKHRFDADGHGRGKAGRVSREDKVADLSEITRPGLRGSAHSAVAAGATDPEALMAAAEEREVLARAAFRKYDKDKSDFLNPTELAALLSEMGFEDADVAAEFSSADTSGDGKVDFSEFVEYFNALQHRVHAKATGAPVAAPKRRTARPARKSAAGAGAGGAAGAGAVAVTSAGGSPLENVFLAFARFGAGSGSYVTELDNVKFSKFARDTGLIGKNLSRTDVDLIFTKVKAKGGRKITFSQFESAVQMIGTKLYPKLSPAAAKERATEKIVAAGGPGLRGVTATDTSGIYGKMTDESLYTGAYKR